MRQVILIFFLMAVGTPALAIAAGQDLSAQTSVPQVTTLVKTAIGEVEGKEWNVFTVELTPGAVDTRHFHPGVELVYVLEGAGFLEVDGKSPVTLNPGVVAALDPKQTHVLKNTSQTQTLKILFVLLEKGQPRLGLGLADRIPNVDSRQKKITEQKNSTPPGLIF